MKVILFGIVQDLIGKSEINFDLEGCKNIECLQEKLMIRFPQLKDLNKFAFAVNESYAQLNTEIKETDVLAIIPPVSGG